MQGLDSQTKSSQIPFLPKYYANICAQRPPQYSQYNTFSIAWGNHDKYEVIKKIGRGKYSQVYQGISNENDQNVVIKILKPVKRQKINRQIKILQTLAGGPNVVKLLDIVRDEASGTPALIFQHINSQDYKQLFPTFTDFDIRFYVYQTLKALDFSHSQGIMHRDVKPHNIIIDHQTRQLRLIDWGLAQFYHPSKPFNVRVASRYYKGPQLLVDDQLYDYSLDIWSTGCMLAGMIFKKEPFLQGHDNNDQLVKIAKVLGTDDLKLYLAKHKLKIPPVYLDILHEHAKKSWDKFVNTENQALVSKDALDLLSKMLLYDRSERICPKDAMLHPYFAPVREYKMKEEADKIEKF